MKPSIYPITVDHPGLLFIMPKPSGEWLHENMQHYRLLGVNMIISMLEPTEISELSLQNESNICADNHVEFLNFPILDRGLPDQNEFKELVCCVLAMHAGSASNAIEFVSQARGVKVPDTQEQLRFIENVVLELMT